MKFQHTLKNTTTIDYNKSIRRFVVVTFNNSFIQEIKIEEKCHQTFCCFEFLIIYFVDGKK